MFEHNVSSTKIYKLIIELKFKFIVTLLIVFGWLHCLTNSNLYC